MSMLASLREALARSGGFGRGGARRTPAADAALREEMEAHFEMHVAEGIRRGMTPEAARRQAQRELGNVTAAVERVRGQRGLPALDALATDLRHAVRVLRLQPGFSLGVILTLGLGIAATVAMFTVLNAVILRPLPYPGPDRIVSLSIRQEGVDAEVADDRSVAAWMRDLRSVEAIGISAGYDAAVQTAGGPRMVRGSMATAPYFRVMGIRPILGRVFTEQEDRPGGPKVIVLGEGLWESAFGGDTAILGRAVVIDGEQATVIGIMPAPLAGRSQFWMPYRIAPAAQGAMFYYYTLARLRPGVTLDAFRAELKAIERRVTASRPGPPGSTVEPVAMTLQERRVGSVRTTLTLLFAAVGVLLLITCANIANLSLARAIRRRREFALRLALGASHWRIVRYVLVEYGVLAIAGSLLGLGLAVGCVEYFVRISPKSIADVGGISIDGTTLAFTLGITVLVTILSGLVPAFAAAREKENVALAGASARTVGSRGQRLVRRGLVVFELATALVLVVGAGLVARSFWAVANTPRGFVSEGVRTAHFALPERSYNDTTGRAFMERLLVRVQGIPGVESAALVDALPFNGARMSVSISEGAGDGLGAIRFEVVGVSPGYLETIGTRVLEGRALLAADREDGARVVVISEALARRLAPERSALGRQLRFDGPDMATVVGVAEDVRQRGIENGASLVAYAPLAQTGGWTYKYLAIRGPVGERALADALRGIVADLDPMLPAPELRPLEDVTAEQVAPRRFVFVLLASFAGLAAVLALLGLYSVMSYLVSEQTREIGIRIALGADARRVREFVLGQGMALTAVGIGVGLLVAYAGARLMESLVYGVGVRDARTFVVTAASLAAVALLASWLPARRASRVDPVGALRADG